MERVKKIGLKSNQLMLIVFMLLLVVSCKDETEGFMVGNGERELMKLVEEKIPYPYKVVDGYYFIELPSEETTITLYSEEQGLHQLFFATAGYYINKQEGYSINEYFEELPTPDYVEREYNASNQLISLKCEYSDILLGYDGSLQFRISGLSSDYQYDNKLTIVNFLSPLSIYRGIGLRFIQRK